MISQEGGKVIALKPTGSAAAHILNSTVESNAQEKSNEFSQKTDEASAESYFHYYVRHPPYTPYRAKCIYAQSG